MRSARCENCGALAEGARCRYCGAVTRTEELVAAGFGDDNDAFGVLRDTQGVSVTRLGTRALRVEVPPETEVGPAVVGCAWTHGELVDIDVSVAIAFERAAPGITAGIWLRSSSTGGAICVQLLPSGALTAVVRRSDANEPLGSVTAVHPARVLRATVQGDLLTVRRDGAVAMSVRCPTSLEGGADLVVEVPRHERGVVVFEDACAKLP